MVMRFDTDARSKAKAALGKAPSTGTSPSGSSIMGPPAFDKDDPPVWMGSITRRRREVEPRGVGANRPNPTIRDVGSTTSERIVGMTAAMGEFYSWVGTPKMKKWADHLINVGYIDPEDADDYSVLAKAWEAAVSESSNAYTTTGGKKKVDPWKMAEFMGSILGGSGRGAGAGSEAFSGTKTETSTTVDLTDPKTAQALVHDILSKQLGRRASTEEVAAFTSVLNNAERSNPVTTTTSTTYQDGTPVSSDSQRQGGLSATGAQELLNEQAMLKPEYKAYQAATTYMDALERALQAPVPV